MMDYDPKLWYFNSFSTHSDEYQMYTIQVCVYHKVNLLEQKKLHWSKHQDQFDTKADLLLWQAREAYKVHFSAYFQPKILNLEE